MDHPDISRILRTGYSRKYEAPICLECGEEIGANDLYGVCDERIICEVCIDEEWHDLTAGEKFAALGYNTSFNG